MAKLSVAGVLAPGPTGALEVGVGEPDATLRVYGQVVGYVQPLTLKSVRKYRWFVVGLLAYDAAGSAFAGI